MRHIKRTVVIPMEPIAISFRGKLVDNHEEGDFYYAITAEIDESKEIPIWERSVASRIQRRLKNAKIAREIIDEIKKSVQQNINKRGKK